MKVARQFIAWNTSESGHRPVGHGMMGEDGLATIRTINQSGVRIRACPTGRILFLSIPGNKLPGYLHSVLRDVTRRETASLFVRI